MVVVSASRLRLAAVWGSSIEWWGGVCKAHHQRESSHTGARSRCSRSEPTERSMVAVAGRGGV